MYCLNISHFFKVLPNDYCKVLFLVEPPATSQLQQALIMSMGKEVQLGKPTGKSACFELLLGAVGLGQFFIFPREN